MQRRTLLLLGGIGLGLLLAIDRLALLNAAHEAG